ncbi:DNA-binding response regulator [Paenibacillus sp. 598K]|uniref:helix-turn-helix domain-containing protein n=1 Tax=Paenibacillus sp. 598K TaxID=1117987 RepID=UPI000FF9411D|nr:helix-turn-helix domain-containing protein [Paenibacillus sp. 598K]GBF74806.1 DNA-binding response regulator [Paenibacillus sp. 598K]
MYNVLLVDDEVHAVRGLQAGVVWDALGIERVYTAHSMRQAQEMFEQQRIDLMICDIEMPQGTGLELAAWVREAHPDTETIFLTCHSDFLYTKQAFKMNSFDYLLKPVDYAELETVIAHALEKISLDQERQQFQETLQRSAMLWEAHRPLRQERFWRDILEQRVRATSETIREHAARHNLPYRADSRFMPVYIRVQRWNKPLTEREQKMLEYALQNAAAERLAGNDPESAIVPVGEAAWLAIAPSQAGERAADRLACARDYIASCHQYFYCDLIVYIGPSAAVHQMAGVLDKLQQSERRNVTSTNEALLLGETPGVGAAIHPPPVKEWAEWMKQGCKKRLLADVERYFNEVGEFDQERLYQVYQDVLQMIFYVLQLKGLHASDVFSERLLTDKPNAALRSIHTFREWVQYLIGTVMSRLHPEENNPSIVDRVKQYIDENLGELELSREEIANYVYLNPDYLTRLFKKETGISISDYLQQQRIKYAKGLLENTDQSVGEIAIAAGYSNISYFSTLFKKVAGLTPADYRKKQQGAI